MSRTEQLEREAEQTRARVIGDLEELRASLTPGQVVDQVADYTNIGAREFLQNLRDQASQNPMAALLVGAGVAWMILGGRKSRSTNESGVTSAMQQTAERATEGVSDMASRASESMRRMGRSVMDAATGALDSASAKASEARDRMGSAAQGTRDFSEEQSIDARAKFGDECASLSETAERGWTGMRDSAKSGAAQTKQAADSAAGQVKDAALGVRESAGAAATRIGDAATSTFSTIKDSASAGYERVSGSVSQTAESMGQSAKQLSSTTASAGRKAVNFAAQEPLIVAGLGIAIGACLGSMFATTEAENQLLGEASDAAKEQLGNAVSEGYEKAKSVAQHATEVAVEETRKQGLSGVGGHDEAPLAPSSDEGKSREDRHRDKEQSEWTH